MTIRIPKNLHLEKLCNNHTETISNYNLKVDKRLMDKIALLCHTINVVSSKKRDYWEDFLNGKTNEIPSVSLSSRILKRHIHDYAKIMSIANEMGIIIITHSWISNEECKKYKFSTEYSGQEMAYYTITTDTLIKSYKKSLELLTEESKKNNPSFLRKYWESGKLTINIPGAMNWVANNQRMEMENLAPFFKELTESELQEKVSKIKIKHELFRTSILEINGSFKKGYLFHTDRKGERIYTSLSNLKKELRQFLSYDNKDLCSIDLKNSHPYILAGLFSENNLFNDGKLEKKLKKGGYWNDKERRLLFNCIIMCLKGLKNLASKDSGIQEYVKLASNGTLYDYIQAQFSDDYEEVTCKKTLKIETLKSLYYDTRKRHLDIYTLTKKIEELFPQVYSHIENLKKGNYQNFAIMLQAIESYLIHDVVCKKIHTVNPKVVLFTIHDCIITTLEHKDFVEKIFIDTLNEIFQLKCNVESKLFNEYKPYKVLKCA